MLKKVMTYTTLDGEEVTEEFYFHFSKQELLEMEVGGEGGSLTDFMQKIIDTKDHAEVIKQMKKLIVMAYGVKSEDGKRFIKNEQMAEEFTQHVVFSDIFMGLATNDQDATEFMIGVLPADMRNEVSAALERGEGIVPTKDISESVPEVSEQNQEPKTDALGRPITTTE